MTVGTGLFWGKMVVSGLREDRRVRKEEIYLDNFRQFLNSYVKSPVYSNTTRKPYKPTMLGIYDEETTSKSPFD